MKKAVIFDLDGTLADTIDDITEGLNGMLKEYGFDLITRERTLNNINNGAFELVRRSLPKEKLDDGFISEAKKVYEKYYSRCFCNKTHEYIGCTQALKSLQDKGVSLSVLSNKQDEFVKVIVSKLFPDIKFDFVIGQGKFPTKPDPSAVNFIINKLNLLPADLVIVGDSNVDMLTAENADITAIGVSWGYRSPEILIENGASVIVNSPNEIFAVLNNLI